MIKPEVSIIIRTKNEHNWILQCLYEIYQQKFKNFEILLIDNNSKDKTVSLVKKNYPKVKIFNFKPQNFFPGQSLNFGASKSKGKYLVFISGHCVPKNKFWLTYLIKNLKKKNIAGVYGKQEPLDTSDPNDIRDLIYIFGEDKKIQSKDPFFHNANSIIKKSLWNKIKFDEKTPHIEDRLWGGKVLSLGYKLVYEPKASVYHYHGLNYRGNENRIKRISKILINKDKIKTKLSKLDCLIPVLQPLKFNNKYIIEKLIDEILGNKIINKIFIICKDKKEFNFLENSKIKLIEREKSLLKEYIGIDFTLVETYKKKIEKFSNAPHLFIVEEPYILRPKNFLNLLIKNFDENYDSIIPICKSENSNLWKKNYKNNELEILFKSTMPSSFIEQNIYQEAKGLGCIVATDSFKVFGRNTNNPKFFEVKNEHSLKLTKNIINFFS